MVFFDSNEFDNVIIFHKAARTVVRERKGFLV